MRVLVCWSGGKNSTRAVYEHYYKGHDVTVVCFIPYFNSNIPLISLEMFGFIVRQKLRFERLGIKVIILRGISYYDWCARILKTGKNKGKRQGFPCFMRGACGFARDGKIKTINNYFSKHIHDFDFIDIGLCADEYDRKKLVGKEISILRDLGINDDDCFDWCRKHNCLSPQYLKSNRDGCVLCPHGKRSERIAWFSYYPEAVPLVLELQSFAQSRNFYPLRGRKYFIETLNYVSFYGNQLSIFGDYVIN